MRVGWRRSPSGGFKRLGKVSIAGRSRVRLTYENAIEMMNAAIRSEIKIPTLKSVFRERKSLARCLANRRSRLARKIGSVEGIEISIHAGADEEMSKSTNKYETKIFMWLFDY